MDRLSAELNRLYALPGQMLTAGAQDQALIAADGRQRALCLVFTRLDDWDAAATLLDGLQNELDLPLPAVSVDGQGFRFWFSFAEPVDRNAAAHFASVLQQRYLAALPAQRLSLAATLTLPPAPLGEDERWIAFIDPSLGSMFRDEAWLAFPPEANRQADLLAGCRSIPPRDFQRLIATTAPPPASPDASGDLPAVHSPSGPHQYGPSCPS